MKKTVKELTALSGLSNTTVRNIFKACKVNFHRAGVAVMDEDSFFEYIEEKKIARYKRRKAKRQTICAVAIDILSKFVMQKYGSMLNFFTATGFNRERWYNIGEGMVTTLSEEEETILRTLADV